MDINISIEGENEVYTLVLINIIGLIIAIEKNVISIEEAENYLFSPYTMNKLKKIGADKDLIELINLGCELENIERLIPQTFNKALNEIREKSLLMLKERFGKINVPTKKWID